MIAFTILFYVCPASAQNEGIGTFSDLVGQALQNPPQPQPSPVIVMQRNHAGQMVPVLMLVSAPTLGLEYDYRRNQQKPAGGLTTDVNEIHRLFSFTVRSTKISFDSVHIWSEGSNDSGGNQNVGSDGIKITLTQAVGKHLLFSLPLFYKNGDGDAATSTGPQTFGTDSFSINPLLILSVQPPILKDANGQPAKEQPLTVSLSPGYRFGITQKNDIRPISPDVNGRADTFYLLAQLDYVPKTEGGENKWKFTGSATWSHLTNFYSSTVVPHPDDNGLGLAGSITYNFLTFKDSSGSDQARLAVVVGYQYDGFNRDYYQHSATFAGKYRFW